MSAEIDHTEFVVQEDAAYWQAFEEHFTATTREEAMSQVMLWEPGIKRARGNKPMQRKFTRNKRKRIIAYDLETTNIDEGTPDTVYVTAFEGSTDKREGVRVSAEIKSKQHFLHVLETELFIKEHNRARFVGYNANRYDALLVALALLLSDDWEIHPYLTKARTVRGMRIIGKGNKKGLEFELLDAMAMTGLDAQGMPLKQFLAKFAPDYSKLDLDFSQTSFDPKNKEHVAYAERDSEGLWYGVKAVNEIMEKLTGNEMAPTMGRAAIQYFQSQMPEGVKVWRPNEKLWDVLHDRAKRGGYVWIAQQYRGPVWKYDINQAYAGAMRDCDLPAGTAVNCGPHYESGKCGVYRCTISRRDRTLVPFYYKDAETGVPGYTDGAQVDTWIMSNEVEHLQKDGWAIEITDGWFWEEKFTLKTMVDNLERLRFTDEGGPSGPLGTIVKNLGNMGYGKTLERLDGVSVVMARTCPDGYTPMRHDAPDAPLFVEAGEPLKAVYHQPQIGCFITAHVRVQVREAALPMEKAFLYADTDSLVFSREARHLDIDAKRYAAWKQEAAGTEYILIGKKVYYGNDGTKHAKGLRIKELGKADFEAWLMGEAPAQRQLQRANFIKMVQGAPMFSYLERTGTNVGKLKTVDFDGKRFRPKREMAGA